MPRYVETKQMPNLDVENILNQTKQVPRNTLHSTLFCDFHMTFRLRRGNLSCVAIAQDLTSFATLKSGWLRGFEDDVTRELWDRSGVAWESLVDEVSKGADGEENVVVAVGHPALNIAVMGHCLNLTKEWLGSFHLDAGSITVVDFPDGPAGRGVIRCINYTAHLGRWSIPITRPSLDDEEF